MKFLIFTIALILSFSYCSEKKNIQLKTPNVRTITINDSLITLIPYEPDNLWIFKDCKSTDLNRSDLINIDKLIFVCINEYNKRQVVIMKDAQNKHPEFDFKKYDFLIDISKYKRQYVAVVNDKEEKHVWINCFCNNRHDWRKEIVFVKDGGNCYFNLKINLTKMKYYEFIVNGNA